MTDASLPPDFRAAMAADVLRHANAGALAEEPTMSALPGLYLTRTWAPQTFRLTCYEPVFCLVLQGRKESDLGHRRVRFEEGRSLIISLDLPAVPHVTVASRERPYLAIGVAIRLAMLRELAAEVGPDALKSARAEAIASGDAGRDMLDVCRRMVATLDNPVAMRTLGNGLMREVHFRLLMAEHGGMLRELALSDSQTSRIARSIAVLRDRYRDKLTVADLAAEAGMSPSVFHDRFRNATGSTPLQYRKRLRMIEAHRLLAEGRAVTEIAFAVGYESSTQFAREFKGEFGQSPSAARGAMTRAA